MPYYPPATAGGSGNVATDNIWDAKGDFAVGTGFHTAVVLPVGENDTNAVADSTQSSGSKYAMRMSLGKSVAQQLGFFGP